jgi:hypothetical protein
VIAQRHAFKGDDCGEGFATPGERPEGTGTSTAHEKLAVAIQKHLDEQVPPLAPQ